MGPAIELFEPCVAVPANDCGCAVDVVSIWGLSDDLLSATNTVLDQEIDLLSDRGICFDCIIFVEGAVDPNSFVITLVVAAVAACAGLGCRCNSVLQRDFLLHQSIAICSARLRYPGCSAQTGRRKEYGVYLRTHFLPDPVVVY